MEKYDKVAIVGRGAFGTVYLARNENSQRVILKQIVIEHLNEAESKATSQEVQVMSLLEHPNIIKYLDNFFHNGALTIVMEFATRGTLYQYLKKQEEYLPQTVILYLYGQLCLALQYIHEKRILHRDITTKNILLTGSEGTTIKLSDFGISKIITSNKASSLVGTPSYLSPELCEGKPYGTHSDVWALGCVLYNMCTLKQAFQAETLASLVMKIMHGVIEPISPTYDDGLMELLQLSLDRDPLNRPSVSEILSHSLLVPAVYHIVTTHPGYKTKAHLLTEMID